MASKAQKTLKTATSMSTTAGVAESAIPSAELVDGDQHALSNISSEADTTVEVVPATLSTDTPESEEPQGGSGDLVAPAEQESAGLIAHDGDDRAGYVDNARAVLKALENGNLDAATVAFDAAKDEFVGKFPLVAAAIDAWQAAGNTKPPVGIRITSKREGFRRANMAHSKTPVEHPLESLQLPEQLERLLAEPILTVELI